MNEAFDLNSSSYMDPKKGSAGFPASAPDFSVFEMHISHAVSGCWALDRNQKSVKT